MSRSTDPKNFFQTDAFESIQARKLAKSGNKNGAPIILQSKILNAVADPFSSTSIYVAESAGCIRKVNIETRDSKTVYRGPTAPLTSVAIGGPGGSTVFAGCWDKDIWSWDRESATPSKKYKGHSDFVKTVICAKIGGSHCLISAGADAKIMVWDISTGERIHTLRDKTETMMAVQDLTLDPEDSTDSEIILISSSSDPHIRRWRISLTSASQILDIADTADTKSHPTRATILEHETSVYKVIFAGDEDELDLWTASADGKAKCLSRAKKWSAEEMYAHGDYVRAVVVTNELAVTAGRDENVKVWDRATGKIRHIYEGHYEEVTGLVILQEGKRVVSVSIDGTVRTWGLSKTDLEKAVREREEAEKGVKVEKVQIKKSLLTEEEDAELAELMDSSDE